MEAATQAVAREGVPRTSLLLRALSDKALVKLSANGSDEAFSILYQRHHGPVFAYCVSILQDYTEAEDALHEVMFRTHQALRESDREIAIKAWLFRCARNHCLNVLQRRAVRDAATYQLLEEGDRVDQIVERREDLRELLADVARLPEEKRAALLMREAAGLSHVDIAAALNTDAARAKRLLFEARRALVTGAEGRAMECAEVRFGLSDGDGRTGRRRDIRSHLRSCTSCREFEESLKERRAILGAGLPMLGPEVGLAMLAKIFGGAAFAQGAVGTSSVAAGSSATASGVSTGAGVAGTAGAGATAGHGAGLLGGVAAKVAGAGLVAKGAAVIATGALVTAGGLASTSKLIKDTPEPPGASPVASQPGSQGGSATASFMDGDLASGDPFGLQSFSLRSSNDVTRSTAPASGGPGHIAVDGASAGRVEAAVGSSWRSGGANQVLDGAVGASKARELRAVSGDRVRSTRDTLDPSKASKGSGKNKPATAQKPKPTQSPDSPAPVSDPSAGSSTPPVPPSLPPPPSDSSTPPTTSGPDQGSGSAPKPVNPPSPSEKPCKDPRTGKKGVPC